MIQSGLKRVRPDHRDYSILHSFSEHPVFGGVVTDPSLLPANFSNYDGRIIPNQNENDARFPFLIPPLPLGCTGETGTFDCGIQDNALYNPQELWLNTPPGGTGGRDIRTMLQRLIDVGPQDASGNRGPKRLAFFNCYGSGAIDDFDAVRIALYINQWEKRNVYIGSYWYWGSNPTDSILPIPSFNIAEGALHCYLATGWKTEKGADYLEVIPWLGQEVGQIGRFWLSRPIFNALMGQPWTGCFTTTKQPSDTPVPVGYQAIVDHLIYYIRALFNI